MLSACCAHHRCVAGPWTVSAESVIPHTRGVGGGGQGGTDACGTLVCWQRSMVPACGPAGTQSLSDKSLKMPSRSVLMVPCWCFERVIMLVCVCDGRVRVCWHVQRANRTSQEARHEEVKQAPELQGAVLDGRATQHNPVLRLEALHSLLASGTQPAATVVRSDSTGATEAGAERSGRQENKPAQLQCLAHMPCHRCAICCIIVVHKL